MPDQRRGRKGRHWAACLRDAVWLKYVQRLTGLSRATELDNRYLRHSGRWGSKDVIRVFGRIAHGTRSPPYSTVRQVDSDPTAAGTRAVFDAPIWAALSDPVMTFAEARESVLTQLDRFELRRATASEENYLSLARGGISGARLAARLLDEYLTNVEPVAALSLLAVLHREADLASCTEMAEVLLRAIDRRADSFLLGHLGFDSWQEYYPSIEPALRYAPRPELLRDDWAAYNPERLLAPLVEVTFPTRIQLGPLQEMLQADPDDRD